jgi:hypothetical protein
MSKKTVYAVTFLIGLYVICQAIADVSATKLVEIGPIVLPAGSMIFAVTFTVRDLLHKRLGKTWAQAAIIVAAVGNILQALYLAWVSKMSYPPFFQNGEAWSAIFAIVPAITIASITAEVVSELIDTEVYHFWSHRFRGFPQWSRVIVSNMVSLPIDSLVFATLAFVILPPLFGGETLPLGAALALTAGQIVFKAAVTLISMPSIYFVSEKPLALDPDGLE